MIKYNIKQAETKHYDQILNILSFWNMDHIPSLEMPMFDIDNCFVAVENNDDNRVVGLAGYDFINETTGKTTLLAVLPDYQGFGIGYDLHYKRLQTMYLNGINKVITHADRPETILFYKKHFFSKKIGITYKLCDFSLSSEKKWIKLETDLDYFFGKNKSFQKRKSYFDRDVFCPPLSQYKPLIINTCLTGVIPTKKYNKYTPITNNEIILDAIKAIDAGSSILHIHARDSDGYHTNDPNIYSKIIGGIREINDDVIITVTTSGRGGSSFTERSAVLHLKDDLKPDMASLTLGSLNFYDSTSINSIQTIQRLALTMLENEIKPELEVFEPGHINLAKYLEKYKLLIAVKYFNFILGNLNSCQCSVHDLSNLISNLPSNSIYSVGGFGCYQLPANTMSISIGGHVRVGIEDNIYGDHIRQIPWSNEDLINRITSISKTLDRKIATPKQARKTLGLLK